MIKTALTNFKWYPMGVMSLYRGTDTTWCFMVKLAVLQRVVSWCLCIYSVQIYHQQNNRASTVYLGGKCSKVLTVDRLTTQYIAGTTQIHIGKSLAFIEHHPVYNVFMSLEIESLNHLGRSREVKSFTREEDTVPCSVEGWSWQELCRG